MISTCGLSSKTIKSTVKQLQYSNFEYQIELDRLKQECHHYQNQTKIYYRKSMKYYKLLYDAGMRIFLLS